MIWIWLRRRPLLVDAGLVAALLAFTVAATERKHESAVALVLGIAETLPLLARRRHPAGVTVVVTLVALAIVASQEFFAPFQLAVALFTLGASVDARAPRRTALASIATMTVALSSTGYGYFGDSAARLVFLVAAWLLGDSIGSRRAYFNELEEKAARLEREQEAHTRQVAAEEQSRIARELHDVVAHALSVVVVQAAAGDDVFDEEPQRARDSLRAIESAARSALGDLRRVLGLLQDGADYRPQQGLAGLDGLVEQVRATGLEISLELEGAPRPLPAAVDLSAYRIVQEALTNTLKHAHAEHATVRVRYGDDLDLEISDDGAGAAAANGDAGRGLIGMRERVAMLGGSVAVGPRPGGGYLVSAHIPL
ncbi:MAG: sensor histidine kinase [Gaiellaceae bacterium]